jgi:Immunoglobulin I-set domain
VSLFLKNRRTKGKKDNTEIPEGSNDDLRQLESCLEERSGQRTERRMFMKAKCLVRLMVCFPGLLAAVHSAGGQTWTKTAAHSNNWSAVASSADGAKLVAAARWDASGNNPGLIYTSADSGKTWMRTSAPSNYWVSLACSADGTELAAVLNDSAYISVDSGATWVATGTLNGPVSVTMSSDGTKLVVAASTQGIYTLQVAAPAIVTQPVSQTAKVGTDGGIDATAFGAGPMAYQWQLNGLNLSGATNTTLALREVASSADGTELAAVANSGAFGNSPYQIYTSTNSGVTWMATSAPRTSWTVASSADGTELMTLSNGAVEISTDSGANWMATGVPAVQFNCMAMSGNGTRLVAAVDSGGIYTLQLGAPAILRQPANRNAQVGAEILFRVTAFGPGPLAYQWEFNGTDLRGATNATLALPNVTPGDNGVYSVLISNRMGSVRSGNAILTVGGASVTTEPAYVTSPTSAILNGVVMPNGTEVVAWFEWGTSMDYGNVAATSIVPPGNTVVPLNSVLSGLNAMSAYHYRLVSWNTFGLVYGADQPFALGRKVLAWGANSDGQTNVPPDLSDVVAVAGGGNHSPPGAEKRWDCHGLGLELFWPGECASGLEQCRCHCHGRKPQPGAEERGHRCGLGRRLLWAGDRSSGLKQCRGHRGGRQAQPRPLER